VGVSGLGLSSRLEGSDPVKFMFYVLEEVKEGWEEEVVPSVCAGDALDPPLLKVPRPSLWIVPNTSLPPSPPSLPPSLSLSLSLSCALAMMDTSRHGQRLVPSPWSPQWPLPRPRWLCDGCV
jgi:hypothetical protein